MKGFWDFLTENKRGVSVVLAAVYGALLYAFPGNDGHCSGSGQRTVFIIPGKQGQATLVCRFPRSIGSG